MKFYNPFKPHIALKNGEHSVRKLCWYLVEGWQYLDTSENNRLWYTKPYAASTLKACSERLLGYKDARNTRKVIITTLKEVKRLKILGELDGTN